ncbi:hypothetical protein HK098_000206 [Nowakowskiella sp. JEL0407]|nr:hypothetical protein HK098_000206 [Nowakowskiella sp. JEL0407]
MGDILSPALSRLLSDKLYERRKTAALEIERVIREYLAAGENDKIRPLILTLVNDFTYSTSGNSKNGGLIALAAVAIALGPEVTNFCDEIVPPILSCFVDPDTRVRYYALESLYNVAKVARIDILRYFNEIFDGLGKLAADPEVSVKNGAELLDRLIKDIVSDAATYFHPELAAVEYSNMGQGESDLGSQADVEGKMAGPSPRVPGTMQLLPGMKHNAFNLPRFIPLLAERVHTLNPFTRMFLVQWIAVLDSIPDLEIIAYLPEFLDGLFQFLSDVNIDVRVETSNVLGEFLKEIADVIELQRERGFLRVKGQNSQKMSLAVDFPDGEKSHYSHTQAIPPPYIQFVPVDEGTGSASNLNEVDASVGRGVERESDPSAYVPGQGVVLDFGKMVNILAPHLSSNDEETQATALRWINEFILLAKEVLIPFTPMLIDSILPSLAHSVTQIRNIAAETNANLYRLIWESQEEITVNNLVDTAFLEDPTTSSPVSKLQLDYQPIVETLTLQFKNDHEETRIASMEWLLMLHRKSPKKVITSDETTFSALLKELSDTSEEVVKRDLDLLAQISQYSDVDGSFLFITLYRSWCHNPVAAFSLCLLAQSYEHAANLLQIFAELEISVNLLVQIDKLVQLLESPVFTYLRLQLLEPDKYPYLYKCMYGIMMLLPQSSAFATLKNRLNSVSSMGILQHSINLGHPGYHQQTPPYHTQVPPQQAAPIINTPHQQPQFPATTQQRPSVNPTNRPKYTPNPNVSLPQPPLSTSTTTQPLSSTGSLHSQQSNESLKWQELLSHFRGIQAGHDKHRRFGSRQSTLSLEKLVRQQQQQRRPLSFRGDVSIDSFAFEDVIPHQGQSELTSPQSKQLLPPQIGSPGSKSRRRSISISSVSSSRSNALSDNKNGVSAPVVTSMSTLLEEQRNNAGSRASSASSYVGTSGSKRSDSKGRGEKNTSTLSGIVKKLTGGGGTSSQSKK